MAAIYFPESENDPDRGTPAPDDPVATTGNEGFVTRESLRPATASTRLLTPKEAAARWRVSVSWLAKARMRGDGPPFLKIGRSIRYSESASLQWLRSRERLSTAER
jgi:predicted DNA-binding transcriptional regulator AlpA